MKITLGPIPFLWEKERILSFYKEISATPVSTVSIGEVVCSKRTILGRDTIEAIARILSDAGKEVVVSTLGLITHRDELNFIESLCSLPLNIEVNNIGVLNLCPDKSRVIGGPHLAVYNAPALKFLAGLGIRRIVFMPELSQQAIESLSLSVPSVEKEIIAFGNLPLAFSWRCYTARALNLSKTNCAIVCKRYPSGMPLDTMEGMPLFNINGTQLMSEKKVCMIEQINTLRSFGIGHLRIIPQEHHTSDIVAIFNKTLTGDLSVPTALEALKKFAPAGISNGWFHGRAGWEYVEEASVKISAAPAS
jgi:collagenase-like PrtC family protease